MNKNSHPDKLKKEEIPFTRQPKWLEGHLANKLFIILDYICYLVDKKLWIME